MFYNNPLEWILEAIVVVIVALLGVLFVLNVFHVSYPYWGGNDHASVVQTIPGDLNGDGELSDTELILLTIGKIGTTDSNATPAPAATAAPNSSNGPALTHNISCVDGPLVGSNYPGPTTAQAKADTKTDLQRLGEECSAFVFRDPSGSNHDTVCSAGYLCTYTLPDKSVKVFVGDGTTYQASAATIRWIKGYSTGDAVYENPPCGLAQKENIFGNGEVPSFPAQGGNFTCGSTTSSQPIGQQITGTVQVGGDTISGTATVTGGSVSAAQAPAQATQQPQASACDTSVLGGSWTHVSGNQYSGSGSITGNASWIIHTPTYPGNPGLPAGVQETVDVATGYCPP